MVVMLVVGFNWHAKREAEPLFSWWSHLHENRLHKFCSVSPSCTFQKD